jgi:hypothetical protein
MLVHIFRIRDGRRFAAHDFGNLWDRHRCRAAADSLIFDVMPLSFFRKIKCLADPTVDPLISRPANHLFEHLPNLVLTAFVLRVPDIRICNVSGKPVGFLSLRKFGRNFPGNLQGIAVLGLKLAIDLECPFNDIIKVSKRPSGIC